MDRRVEDGVDEPAYVMVGIPARRIGPNLSALVAVLGPLVDRVEVVDYREHPEHGHVQRREQLAAWALDRYTTSVTALPQAQLSDVWNLLALRCAVRAEGKAWTLVIVHEDARPDADVLEQLVAAVVDDYDVAFGPGAFALGFPPGTDAPALVLGDDLDSEADCLLDLLERIPEDRRTAIQTDPPLST